MNPDDDQPNEAREATTREAERSAKRPDLPSMLMLLGAVLVIAWSFWPAIRKDDGESARVAVGQFSPPLRCSDPVTGEPLLGLVPRGWFVWIVLAPDDDPEGVRLRAELERAETVWKTMADLDQWRRVIVTADERSATELRSRKFEPHLTPVTVGLRRNAAADVWSGAQRVRHLLVEPTGRILLIEPAETDHPGGLEKIRNDLRRRLRAWEGEFDDLPRFS